MCLNKYILYVANTIMFVFGIIVVSIASATIAQNNGYGDLLYDGFVSVPIGILIIGLIICIVSLLGCFGAHKEHKILLMAYSAIVLVLFLAEYTMAIVLVTDPQAVSNNLKTSLQENYMKYKTADEEVKKSIDNMQIDLQCCGVESYTDWVLYWPTTKTVPWSCCDNVEKKNPCDVNSDISRIHKKGCLDALEDQFTSLTSALSAIAIILSLAMLCSMCTAFALALRGKQT